MLDNAWELHNQTNQGLFLFLRTLPSKPNKVREAYTRFKLLEQ